MNLTTEMLMHFSANSEGEQLSELLMSIIPMLTPRQMKMLEPQFKYKMVYIGEQEDDQTEEQQTDEDQENATRNDAYEMPKSEEDDELEIPKELR